MSEELLSCPFCGGKPDLHPQGFVECTEGCGAAIGLDDPEASIAAWNRRSPPASAELREAVARAIGSFLIFDDKGGPDDVVLTDVIGGTYDEATARVYELTDRVLSILPPQPEPLTVPETSGQAEGLPPISFDGPHPICEHRAWLARQLLDSKLSDDEAYGIVRYSPAINPTHDEARSGWRPIETHEGCHAVLVSRPTGRELYAATTAFLDATGVWRVYRSDGGMTPLPFAPSHWMPLPSPPNPTTQAEGGAG